MERSSLTDVMTLLTRPFRLHSRLLPLVALLLACATHPASRSAAGTEVDATCDRPETDQCVTLGCDEGWCAFFRCEEVTP